MSTHEVYVAGISFNTGDAGVGVWCKTCGTWLLEGDDYGDRLLPDQIAAAVTAHTAPVNTATEGA